MGPYPEPDTSNLHHPTLTSSKFLDRNFCKVLPLGDINTEVWSCGMGVGRGANNSTL
jgi:hypothetical protein